jgi:3-phosphoshikimate 1-carboxyvinyltransferase
MQRAVACAALAAGDSTLIGPSDCADSRAALEIARALGAEVEAAEGQCRIRGIGFGGVATGIQANSGGVAGQGAIAPRTLSCGESGLCLRMFTPIAALFPGETELAAEGSLRRRPVTQVEGPLAALGAACRTASGLPPVTVSGPMRGGAASVDGSASSQFLTGLLIALPLCTKDSLITVPRIVSSGYVDLTLDTMRAFGVEAERSGDFGSYRVRGGQRYAGRAFQVECDWSGAAFLLAAGALAAEGDGLCVEGLALDSSQPDRAILDALRAIGARVEVGASLVKAGRGELRPFSFDATDCPDLFPPLVALAAACGGVSELRGASRLRAKESDRAAALSEEFGSLGVPIEVEGDVMRIHGGRILGGAVSSRGDHRIAMAAAVASLVAEAEVSIEGAECVEKSWPTFFDDLASIGL